MMKMRTRNPAAGKANAHASHSDTVSVAYIAAHNARKGNTDEAICPRLRARLACWWKDSTRRSRTRLATGAAAVDAGGRFDGDWGIEISVNAAFFGRRRFAFAREGQPPHRQR
jgi:hypothetical protein